MKHFQKGFTAVEAMVVLCLLFFIAVPILYLAFWCTLVCGNFYYLDSGILQELQIDHPEVESVRRTKRNVWDYSKIRVMNDDGTESCYYLDTNVLFNYELRKAPSGPPC